MSSILDVFVVLRRRWRTSLNAICFKLGGGFLGFVGKARRDLGGCATSPWFELMVEIVKLKLRLDFEVIWRVEGSRVEGRLGKGGQAR